MLKSWNHYEYVNQSGCASINGVDDSKKFDGLRLALNVLQVTTEDTESIFSVVAGILWLGNLRFKVTIYWMLLLSHNLDFCLLFCCSGFLFLYFLLASLLICNFFFFRT